MMSQSEPAVSVCPHCGGTGWKRVQREGAAGVARCDCQKSGLPERLLQNARIPARYTHCELGNYDLNLRFINQSHQRAKLVAETFVREYPTSTPFGLLFMGPQGVGKTHLGVGIIKGLIQLKSVPCLFRTFPELLKEIQNSYSPISQSSELALLGPVLETEVLVLDELGAQTPSSWVKDTVSYIINYRYAENKVTMFTSNYLDKEVPAGASKGASYTLAERIGDPMRSRLYEMCKTIVISGDDFRQKIPAEDRHHF
jgi:DNA replication protein DnaC